MDTNLTIQISQYKSHLLITIEEQLHRRPSGGKSWAGIELREWTTERMHELSGGLVRAVENVNGVVADLRQRLLVGRTQGISIIKSWEEPKLSPRCRMK